MNAVRRPFISNVRNVAFWHLTEIPAHPPDVRYQGKTDVTQTWRKDDF